MTIRKNYEALRDKSIQKEKEIQLEIQKTLAGKTTMKTLFSKGSKDDAVTTLEKNLGLVFYLQIQRNFLIIKIYFFRLKRIPKSYSSFAIS